MITIFLKERCTQILYKLISSPAYTKISELAEEFGVSQRTIRYDLDKIDYYLKHNGLPQLVRKPNSGIQFNGTSEQRNKVLKLISNISSYNYVLTPRERQNIILSQLLQTKNYITIGSLSEILSVSRSTVINDLRKVKGWLIKNNLKLKSSPGHGINIEGNEKDLRNAVVSLLAENVELEKAFEIIKAPLNRRINVTVDQQVKNLFEDLDIGLIEETVRMAENQLQTVFSDRTYSGLVIHIALAIKRIQLGRDIVMLKDELDNLRLTKEFAVASSMAQKLEEYFHIKIPVDEIGYITVHLLGGKVVAASTHIKENWAQLQLLTAKIIESVQSEIKVNFFGDDELYKGLMEHLGPTIYRLKHGLLLKNPILEEVKRSYSRIFQSVKKGLKVLEDFIGGHINEEEVGYITMHFGAALERAKARKKAGQRKNHRILVVCGTGIGTAKLLSSRIKAEFDDIEIADTAASRKVREKLLIDDIDFIVSTIPMNCDKVPEIVVNPLLPQEDITKIRKYIENNPPKSFKIQENGDILKNFSMEELLEIIESHCIILHRSGLVKDLAEHLNLYCSEDGKGVVQPVLKDLLTKKTIKLKTHAKNWEEAVRIGGEILVENGYVEPGYVDAMVKTVKEIGPYIVIAPGIAMPHARPEDGVKKVCMSLITLDSPVSFVNSNNDPVDIVICFGATDDSTHLKALSQIVELLRLSENVNKIRDATVADEIIVLFETIE